MAKHKATANLVAAFLIETGFWTEFGLLESMALLHARASTLMRKPGARLRESTGSRMTFWFEATAQMGMGCRAQEQANYRSVAGLHERLKHFH